MRALKRTRGTILCTTQKHKRSRQSLGENANSDYDAFPEGVPEMIVSRFEGDHRSVSLDQNILVRTWAV